MKASEIIESKNEEITELFQQGFGWKQIAAHIGIDESKIKNNMAKKYLKKAGFDCSIEYKREKVTFGHFDEYIDYSKEHNVGEHWYEDETVCCYEYTDIA